MFSEVKGQAAGIASQYKGLPMKKRTWSKEVTLNTKKYHAITKCFYSNKEFKAFYCRLVWQTIQSWNSSTCAW
jgi:hypothetical protein